MIDIPEYEGLYKFDNEIEKVYNIKKNKYLKNTLSKGFYYVGLYKNGKVKTYGIRQLSSKCNNPIENINLIDIPKYEGLYKFDLDLEQVYNINTNMYLKNKLDFGGYYLVGLHKNKIKTTYKIHQLVYICNNPTEDIIGFEIDHIDNDRTNNKIENLRKATKSDNQSNRKTNKNNKLGIKYISKTKWNTYTFSLTKNKINYRKNFKTLEQAIEHRNRVVLEICGEYANLG